MANEPDSTQKKTLRLKKAPRSDVEATQTAATAPGTVPAVVGGPQNRPADRTGSNLWPAIVAIVATLAFAALVFIQYRELQTYKYAFPRPAIEAVP